MELFILTYATKSTYFYGLFNYAFICIGIIKPAYLLPEKKKISALAGLAFDLKFVFFFLTEIQHHISTISFSAAQHDSE